MKIILTRHCETDWNKIKRLQGKTDTPLNDAGKLEARKLAHCLAPHAPSVIISSNLARAQETARIIAYHLGGVAIISDERLQECSFGELEGLTLEEISHLYGPELSRLIREEFYIYDFRLFGGESRDNIFKRHQAALEDMKHSPYNSVLVIGHGKGLNTLLAGLGLSPNLVRGNFQIIEA